MMEEKALELKSRYLGRDLVEELTAPTSEDLILTRPIRGGGTVAYVPGPNFIRKLNECFGFLWSYEVPVSHEKNGQIVGKGRLTVHVPVPRRKVIKRYIEDGRQVEEESVEYEILGVVKEQFGSSEIKKYSKTEYAKDREGRQIKDTDGQPVFKHKAGDVIDLGDDYKGMGTDAMKKCATQLGIFLDVYEKRAGEEEGGGVSKGQLETFLWRAEQAGLNKEQAEKWGEEQVGKPISHWAPLDAMRLIPALIDMAKEKKE